MRVRVTFVCACVSVALGAQQERPSFQITTRLVEFTLVAVDKKGSPVTDLGRDEVVVQVDGRRRDVSFFQYEGAAAATHQPALLPTGIFSNRLEYLPGPPRSISAIVLDALNTEPSQVMWARAQVTRSLRALAPDTRVAVYHLGTTLGVIHDFTDDLESLREKIGKATVSLPAQTPSSIDAMARDAEQLLAIFPEDQVLQVLLRHQTSQIEAEGVYNATVRQRRLALTLSALETLGQHLAGIPGRKNVVWIGGGISMLTVTGAMGFGLHGGAEGHEEEVSRSAQRLAQQGVALYVVDARGLRVPKQLDAAIGSGLPLRGARPFELQQQTEEVSADPLPAASLLANVTGGRVIKNTNDPIEGVAQAARDMRGAYSVGFYADEVPDGKWNRLTVRVTRPGVRVVHRLGFLAEQPLAEPARWSREQWLMAAADPIGSTAVALDATFQGVAEAEPGTVVLSVQLDPSTLYFRPVGGRLTAEVEFGIADKAADGRVKLHSEGGSFALGGGDSPQQAQSGLFYTRRWVPMEGTRTIRIMVRDTLTGRQGTLDVPYDRVRGIQPGSPGVGDRLVAPADLSDLSDLQPADLSDFRPALTLTCLTALAVLASRQRLGAHPRRASAETAVHEGGAPAADDDPWRGLERHEIQLDQKLLVVKGSKGVIGCPYLDVGMFEKLGEACAIIPAVDTAGMLDSKVTAVTPRARELGIEVGMPGREALDKIRQERDARRETALMLPIIRPRPSASLVNASPS